MERSVWTSFGPFGSCDISRKTGTNPDGKERKWKKKVTKKGPEWEGIIKLSLLVRQTNCHLQGRNWRWLMDWIECDAWDTIHTYRTDRERRGVCFWREREDHSPPEKGRGQRREIRLWCSQGNQLVFLAIEEKNWLILNSVVKMNGLNAYTYSYVWLYVWVYLRLARGGYDCEWYIHNNTYIQ